MLISLGYFVMGTILLIGGFHIFRSDIKENIKKVSRVYGIFFLSMSLFFILIASANSFVQNSIAIQLLDFFALYIALFFGLAFGALFTLMMSGQRLIGFMLMLAIMISGIYFFIDHIQHTSIAIRLGEDTYYAYWNPMYTRAGILGSIIVMLLTAIMYAVSLFKLGLASVSIFIRKRSFLMASGAVFAILSGIIYFVGHFFASPSLPIALAISTIPGSIGFGMMVYPLFLKEEVINA